MKYTHLNWKQLTNYFNPMKKLIDIPEEIVIPLKIKAAKQNRGLKYTPV